MAWLSGAEDKHGYLWDRHYGVCVAKFPHADVVNSVAFNPRCVDSINPLTVKALQSIRNDELQSHRSRSCSMISSSAGIRNECSQFDYEDLTTQFRLTSVPSSARNNPTSLVSQGLGDADHGVGRFHAEDLAVAGARQTARPGRRLAAQRRRVPPPQPPAQLAFLVNAAARRCSLRSTGAGRGWVSAVSALISSLMLSIVA